MIFSDDTNVVISPSPHLTSPTLLWVNISCPPAPVSFSCSFPCPEVCQISVSERTERAEQHYRHHTATLRERRSQAAMRGLLLGLLLLVGQCLGSRGRREMMIAAIFDHHHQTSNIQHEIAFRHAVQMVNENRWVPSEEVKDVETFFGNLCLAWSWREGGKAGVLQLQTAGLCWQKLFFIRKPCKTDTLTLTN